MNEKASRPPKLPPRWFMHTFWRAHRALCRLSGGRFLWTPAAKRGWGALLLTTTGRKTGRERHVVLGYIEDGADLVVLAMNGFEEGDPAWWLNLEAHPDAVVRLAHRPPRPVHARRCTGAERERLWKLWLAIEPETEYHAARRTTEIPVVVFEPVAGSPG